MLSLLSGTLTFAVLLSQRTTGLQWSLYTKACVTEMGLSLRPEPTHKSKEKRKTEPPQNLRSWSAWPQKRQAFFERTILEALKMSAWSALLSAACVILFFIIRGKQTARIQLGLV